ncbi:MAG TPA: hypothetical protein VLL98_05450 [Rickettsiales bacterium]|nr:hypothetical protein [Rickettsiales bacterium]
MIDTIVMILEKEQFRIDKPERFNPNAKLINKYDEFRGNGEIKFIYNPSLKEQEKAYYPRLTLSKRSFSTGGFKINLKIEFSIPKLVFGNNFDELEENDFNNVLETLFKRLEEMEIYIAKEILINAYIQKIDYSKNVILDKYTTCSMVISQLSKLNTNKRLDVAQTKYKNEGQSITYHSSSFELTFYDKVKDLEQSKSFGEKRSMEVDNQYCPDLFHYTNYKEKVEEKHLEVLRFEGRFSRTKLKSLFKKLNINANLTFKELFNKDIARKILLYYWSEIIEDLHIMNFDTKNIGNLIKCIKNYSNNTTTNKISKLIGIIATIQSIGSRATRIELKIPDYQWYSLQKEIKAIESDKTNYSFLAIYEFGKKLEEFKALKLKDCRLKN